METAQNQVRHSVHTQDNEQYLLEGWGTNFRFSIIANNEGDYGNVFCEGAIFLTLNDLPIFSNHACFVATIM